MRGEDLPVFDLLGMRTAMFVCYDLRFPEAFRDAALRGAELFVVPANWPARRAEHWRTLLRARAIENQAWVVGVNRVGRDPNEAYAGSSLAVGPAAQGSVAGKVTAVNGAAFVLGPSIGVGMYEVWRPLPYLAAAAALVLLLAYAWVTLAPSDPADGASPAR